MGKLNVKNKHQVPKIKKIILNMGLGEEGSDGKKLKSCVDDMSLIAGQKGLVEEKDLRIPSMRGIMTARTKPLEVMEPNEEFQENIKIVNFEKPEGRSECTFINDDQVEKLIDLLANEAKVI